MAQQKKVGDIGAVLTRQDISTILQCGPSRRGRTGPRRSVMHPSDHAPEQKAVIGQSETEVVIRPFDPLTAIRADWMAFHAYRRAHHEEASPDDPILTDEQVEENERDPNPEGDSPCWVASANGRIVASLSA